MEKNNRVIDFHTHIMTLAGVEQSFPDARQTLFWKHVVPLIEPIADITEGLHDRFLRNLAMHYNNKLSRLIYSRCGELFMMEALRLFKRHGLERLVENMDKLGIDHSVIYSLEPLTSTQEILEQVKAYPGRFSVFASVARSEPDPVGYLRPFVESGSVCGIKIHPMVGGYHADDLFDATKEYIALAEAYGLPVTFHTGDIPVHHLTNLMACSEIPVIARIIRAFPNCTFILNHLGWESWRAAMQLAKECPNIYVETSWQPARIMRRAVGDIGRDRVIFGSDYPMFQQWQALREVKRAFRDDDLEAVTWSNARRLLKLPDRERMFSEQSAS